MSKERPKETVAREEERCTLPWQRYDKYGECGLDPQPLSENIRLIIFAILLVPIKLCGAVAALLSFFVVTKLAWILPKSVRSDWVATLGKIHCRVCLFFIGFVRVRWVDLGKAGQGEATSVTPVGIVSNHCSWCDILVHMSHFFPAFVSRKSTSTSPIVGSIRYRSLNLCVGTAALVCERDANFCPCTCVAASQWAASLSKGQRQLATTVMKIVTAIMGTYRPRSKRG